jgi:DNA-binding Lrp family transcriptional regulator
VSISAVDPAKPSRNAFIFITTEPDCCRTAFEDLKKLEHVQEVYLSHGAYDIIAKVNGESLDYLREVVLKQIKNLTSIKSTLTLTLI